MPPDVRQGTDLLIERGIYPDLSKTLVALLRKALSSEELLPPMIMERVDGLAEILQRSREAIIRQCVEDVLEMLNSNGGKTPLLIEEVRLRERRKTVGSSSRIRKPSR